MVVFLIPVNHLLLAEATVEVTTHKLTLSRLALSIPGVNKLKWIFIQLARTQLIISYAPESRTTLKVVHKLYARANSTADRPL